MRITKGYKVSKFQFNFTVEQLKKIIPNAVGGVDTWYECLSSSLLQYDINTLPRVASFIAQCSHESGGFVHLQENLKYKADRLIAVWPKIYTPDLADKYAGKPEAIANKSYGGKLGNGVEETGDGWRYRGRGIIQLTGKDNYLACSRFLFHNDTLLKTPDILLEPQYAVLAACWFWHTKKLNQYADTSDFVTMTKRINGGTQGIDDRIKQYNKAVKIFSQ